MQQIANSLDLHPRGKRSKLELRLLSRIDNGQYRERTASQVVMTLLVVSP